jgi:glutathione S-transferase
MRLYYAPGTIANAIAIALREAGLEHETVKVNFAEAEQTKAPYLGLNPKGRVPALETGGSVLSETGAILDYIATVAPGAGLMPADPVAAAHVRAVMYYLASTAHVNHAHKFRAARWADRPESHADMVAKVPETMAQTAAYLNDHALRGAFVAGDAISVADPYLFVVCTWLKGDGVDIAAYPRLAAHFAAMRARPSVQACVDAGMIPALASQ